MPIQSPIHSDNYPASFYHATAKELFQHPRLEESLETDVCVIGAGFSGLNSAIELAERGFAVTILEAKKVGWGARGVMAGS